MKTYTVAVLGATGAVGQEMMNILEERNFPVGKLIPLASARSAGKTLKFKGEDITIQLACDEAFEGVDIVLGAAENDIAKKFAPAIVKAGAVFVDNSSAFRMDPEVPLVVPEVNPEDVKWHKGIISNPNCSTIITVTAVNALNAISPIRAMTASTYQAVSGAGAEGPVELMNEVEALSKGETYEPKVFPYQIAYNLIPQIGGEQFEGYTSEEMKMQNEGRKIMHLPELKVSFTPGASFSTSRTSSTVRCLSKCMHTEMEWLRMTGTRTQVQVTFSSGRCMIFRPSFCIFISSLV